jgi:ClpP class serine protease
MAHSLHRLLASLYSVPHLVTAEALKPIIDYLQMRNSVNFAVVPQENLQKKKEQKQYGDVGEILIDGALSYQPVYGECGVVEGTSYVGILAQAQELINGGIKVLVTTHSSPGGQAMHCFSTANDLRKMCTDAGVHWISYIDEQSASASLAIGIAADEVIIHPSAETGSIGCVCAILDASKALENAGLKPIYISSTPGKTPFNEDGSFSEEFLSRMQESVTKLGNQFIDHVNKYTGLSAKEISDMDAKMFDAEEALSIGLVNKIMDHNQFVDYLSTLTKGAN